MFRRLAEAYDQSSQNSIPLDSSGPYSIIPSSHHNISSIPSTSNNIDPLPTMNYSSTSPPTQSYVPETLPETLPDMTSNETMSNETMSSKHEKILVDQTKSDYKRWFFDQQLAKKEMFFHTCKQLDGYQDLDHQSLPANDPLSTHFSNLLDSHSNSSSMILSNQHDEHISLDDRPSGKCIPRDVIINPQQSTNTISLALNSSSSPPSHQDSHDLANRSSVQIYHHVTRPPIPLDIKKKATIAIHHLLQTPTVLPSTISSTTSSLTREMSFPSGKDSDFNFCQDLPDSTTPPYSLSCLQQLFLKMGGKTTGTAYPTEDNITYYNQMLHLGRVKQSIQTLVSNQRHSSLQIQLDALMQLFGISPHSLIPRAPFVQGVEVFWFVPGQKKNVIGFLKRTIETHLLPFKPNTPFFLEQSGIPTTFSLLQITDVRAKEDIDIQFGVQTSGAFFITTNHPADGETLLMDQLEIDQKGFFGNLQPASSSLSSQTCTTFRKNVPNMTKFFYEHSSSQKPVYRLFTKSCSTDSSSSTSFFDTCPLSLTCELRAPFLHYEVDLPTMEFQELRNPMFFGQLLGRTELQYHTRSEEREHVPGKKGFIRMNNGKSSLQFSNMAYSSWTSMTMSIRLRSMPVKETILSFQLDESIFHVIVKPDNGNQAIIYLEHNIGTKKKKLIIQQTGYQMSLQIWYLMMIQQYEHGFHFLVQPISSPLSSIQSISPITIHHSIPLSTSSNSLSMWNIIVGGGQKTPTMYSTVSFYYDIAWVHFFDYPLSSEEIQRDARADWIYTAFPTTPYSYQIRLP